MKKPRHQPRIAFEARALAALIAVFCCVAVLFAMLGCTKQESKPSTAGPSPAKFLERPEKPFMPVNEAEVYCVVDYFFRGEELQRPSMPFSRCTREGDFLVIRRGGGEALKVPVLAIRMQFSKEPLPFLDESTFSVQQDGRPIQPLILPLAGDGEWFGQISWSLDPGWKELRIGTDVKGKLATGDFEPTTTRFDMAMFEGSVDWSRYTSLKNATPGKITIAPSGPCLP
jgi:hypothetical protein